LKQLLKGSVKNDHEGSARSSGVTGIVVAIAPVFGPDAPILWRDPVTAM
jgi:hypothetical protein